MSGDRPQRRTHRLAFRVSDEERQLVNEHAAACGLTLSAYLRSAALGRLPRRRRRGDERDLVHHLARLANSLRHLSRLAANTGRRRQQRRIEDVLHRIDRAVREVIDR